MLPDGRPFSYNILTLLIFYSHSCSSARTLQSFCRELSPKIAYKNFVLLKLGYRFNSLTHSVILLAI